MRLIKKIRRAMRLHSWEYRNPYNRTCDECQRHEVMFCLDWHGPSWWEVYSDGDTAKPCNPLSANHGE